MIKKMLRREKGWNTNKIDVCSTSENMSFFSRFKKKSVENSNNKEPKQTSYTLDRNILPNGNYTYDFVDHEYDPNKFYNVTYLEVNPKYKMIEGIPVYEAKVSWYKDDDAQLYNPETGQMEYLRKKDTSKIMIEVDLNSLVNDPKYTQLFMRNLLSEERVASYLERGLEENPNGYKCGNYIGGVKYNSKTGKLQKIFDTSIGEAIHNSPEMVQARVDEAKRKRNELLNNLGMYEARKAQDIKEIDNIKKQLRNFDDEHSFNRNDDNDDLDR